MWGPGGGGGGGPSVYKLRARRHGRAVCGASVARFTFFTTLQDSLSDNAGFVLTLLSTVEALEVSAILVRFMYLDTHKQTTVGLTYSYILTA